MNGIERIAAERQRQIEAEGWTPEHDAQHKNSELALAGAVYAIPAMQRHFGVEGEDNIWSLLWPWAPEWWKPGRGDRIRELEKAGALIAAEIDRLAALDAEEGRNG